MWFRRIKLKNAGRFEDLDVDLTRGSIGVFGPNGAGKSSLLNFMYAAVTNDFGRFAGTKDQCVRNTAPAKSESYVHVEVCHNEHTLEITRRLRGKSEVVIDGGKPETDTNKGQALVYEILGIDKALIDLYVFKPNNKIYDFIDSVPSVRAKAYQTLCRTERCEELWDLFGEFLNKDREVNAQVVDNSDDLQRELAALAAQADELRERVETEKAKLLNAKSRASAQRILDDDRRHADLLAELEKVERRLAIVGEHRVQAADGRFDKCRLAVDRLTRQVDAERTRADAARLALKSLAQYAQHRKQRQGLLDTKAKLDAEERQNRPPKAPPAATREEELRREKARLEHELVQAQDVWTTFTGGELDEVRLVKCPTCGTPVDNLHDHIEAAKAIVIGHPGRTNEIESTLAAIGEYRQAARTYEKWKAGFEARRKANEEAVARLVELAVPEGDKAALEAVVAEERELLDKLSTAEDALDAAKTERATAKAEFEAAQQRKEELDQEIEEKRQDPDLVARAKVRIDEDTTARTNTARLEGQLDGVRAAVKEKERELDRLRARLARSERVRNVAMAITRARDAVHRDRLPRRVAQINLAAMEGDINTHLAAFGDPYWVEADADLSFVAHKPGEPPQPATWLSTGQRVVLAMAFWPAVASLWASDLGMLALDEPTANLDEQNRKFLADAVGELSGRVRGRRQLIVVTHDPNLRTAFDQVIDLGV